MYISDDHRSAVLTWRLVATSFSGPGAGRTIRARGVDLYTFRDASISEQVIIYDSLDLSRQLGPPLPETR